MTAQIKIVGMYDKCSNGFVVNTTSKAKDDWQRELSPFYVGPCKLWGSYSSLNMENAWQFVKVYSSQVDANRNPTQAWWTWAQHGWSDPTPHRYPMGKGAVPLYSYWDGNKLNYIEARKTIYGPLYAKAVMRTEGYQILLDAFACEELIVLRDYDGYDHDSLMMSLSDVLNNPKRKMGHAFVLKMLLTRDKALKEFVL